MFSHGMFSQPPQPGGGGTPTPTPTLPVLTSGAFGLTASPGATMTSGGANTKGSIIGTAGDLGTLTDHIDEFSLFFGVGNVARQIVFDVLSNGTEIVKDFSMHCGQSMIYAVRFPISVPTGAALKFRFAAPTASAAINVQARGVKYDLARSETLVESMHSPMEATVATQGVTVTSDAGWTAVGGTTANGATGVIVTAGLDNDVSRITATLASVQLSVDGGTTTLDSFLIYQTASTGVTMPATIWGAFPAGTQFHVRIVGASAISEPFNVNIHLVR